MHCSNVNGSEYDILGYSKINGFIEKLLMLLDNVPILIISNWINGNSIRDSYNIINGSSRPAK